SFQRAARRARALALVDLGRAQEALALLAELPVDDDTQLARAQARLAGGEARVALALASAARDGLLRAGRVGERWRAELLLARAAHAAGEAGAARGAAGRGGGPVPEDEGKKTPPLQTAPVSRAGGRRGGLVTPRPP